MAKTKTELAIIPSEIIADKIYIFRGHRVMVDRDLSELYRATTKVLNQAVKRNIARFPGDFMFQLNNSEKNELVTNCDRFETLKHSTSLPYVFTEQGVAMLSSVLNSERAINVNIQIIRTFTKIRELLATNEVLRKKIEAVEQKYDQKFKVIFDVIKKLISDEEKPSPSAEATEDVPKKKIGFEVRK